MDIPLEKIRRPLMRTRANDPHKVHDLMASIRLIGLQVPVRAFTFSSSSYLPTSYHYKIHVSFLQSCR